MAKLTGGQREYFRERIGQSFASKLAPLEKVAAVKKSELVDDKFDEFIGELGLRKSATIYCKSYGKSKSTI